MIIVLHVTVLHRVQLAQVLNMLWALLVLIAVLQGLSSREEFVLVRGFEKRFVLKI